MARPFSVFAVALSLALAVGGIGPARAEETPPDIFDVAVDAAPVAVSASVPSALPLAAEAGVARSSVTINSQPNAVSQAAIVWVPLAEAAPALFGLPALPSQASLWCYSYFPGEPREVSCGGPAQNVGPLDVAGGSAHTKTTGESSDPGGLQSESSAVAASVKGNATLPAALKVANAASAARAGKDGARMASGASTAVTGIDVGGVLQIDSLRSEVTGALGGVAGSAVHKESLVVGAASVAGQPVRIDNDGVHASGASAGGELFSAQKEVDAALAAAGIQVHTLPARPAQVAEDGTSLELTSGGIVVSLAPGQGQADTVVRFGVSRLVMSAHRTESIGGSDLGGAVGDLGGDAAPLAEDVPAPPAGDGVPAPSVEGTGTELALPPPAAPTPGSTTGPPSANSFRREVITPALSQTTWKVPYAPFALLVLAGPLLLQVRRLSITRRTS